MELHNQWHKEPREDEWSWDNIHLCAAGCKQSQGWTETAVIAQDLRLGQSVRISHLDFGMRPHTKKEKKSV